MSRIRPLSVRPLTDAERLALQDSLRSPDAFVRCRAQIVLASAAGQSSEQIAPRVGFTTQGVRDMIQAFNARGLDVVRPASYQPGVAGSSLEGPGAPALHALHHQSPRTYGHDTSPWTLEAPADVADEQGWTAPHVGGLPMRTTSAWMDVCRPRANEWLISPDPEYARKQAGRDRLIRLAQGHPDWLLGCAEEVGPSRSAHPDLRGSVNDRHATPHPQPPLPSAPFPSPGEGGSPHSGSRASPLPHTGRGAGGEGTSSLRQDHSLTLPDLHAGQEDDHALRLIEQTVTRDDVEPQAQAQRVRVTHMRRDAIPRPPLRLRRRTIAAIAAAVVLLLLAAVTEHVLTTPAHKPVFPSLISSHPPVPSSTSLPAIGWVSAIAVAVLLLLLVEKQRVVEIPGGRATKLNRALTIAILPLLCALAFNVLVEVAASVSQGS